MSAPRSSHPVEVRDYRESDEPRVLELLLDAFGRWPPDLAGISPGEFLRWKHLEGAFGPSISLVAEVEGSAVGFAGYMRWPLHTGADPVVSVRAVDLAVDPAYRRRGTSLAIRLAAKERFRGSAALMWGNPNERAAAGSTKVGEHTNVVFQRFVRPGRQPAETLRRARAKGLRTPVAVAVEAETAGDVLRDEAHVAGLLEASGCTQRARLRTAVDPASLRWRYGRFEEYRAVRTRAGSGGEGLAIFRMRRHGSLWVSDICELLVEGDAVGTGRELLKRVGRAAPADLLSCAFSSPARAAHHGFFQSGRGMVVTLAPLVPGLVPDPVERSSWALSRGDLELL